MILQLMIRQPDEELDDCYYFGIHLTKSQCEEYCSQLQAGVVPKRILLIGLSICPYGYIIEAVAYGAEDEEPLAAYDLTLKVLN